MSTHLVNAKIFVGILGNYVVFKRQEVSVLNRLSIESISNGGDDERTCGV